MRTSPDLTLLTETIDLVIEKDDNKKEESLNDKPDDKSSINKDVETAGQDVLLFGDTTSNIGRKFHPFLQSTSFPEIMQASSDDSSLCRVDGSRRRVILISRRCVILMKKNFVNGNVLVLIPKSNENTGKFFLCWGFTQTLTKKVS